MTDADRDAEAVRAVLKGDRERFGELLARHQKRVYSIVFRLVGRAAEAEDLTQQAFVEAFVALKRFDPNRPFSAWLSRIAVNNCKDYLKSHKRREVGLAIDPHAGQAFSAGRVPSPEQATVTSRRAKRTWQALQQLDPSYRIPLVLKDVEGLSYQEMQQVLDLPLTTLKIRVVRARDKLQELLEWTRDEKN